LDETTIRRIIEEDKEREREDLNKATDNAVRRVLNLVRAREADFEDVDNPTDLTLEPLDLALLTIKYGTFSEEGFFKILRNNNFGTALGVSLIVGLVTWAISNIIHILG